MKSMETVCYLQKPYYWVWNNGTKQSCRKGMITWIQKLGVSNNIHNKKYM